MAETLSSRLEQETWDEWVKDNTLRQKENDQIRRVMESMNFKERRGGNNALGSRDRDVKLGDLFFKYFLFGVVCFGCLGGSIAYSHVSEKSRKRKELDSLVGRVH